MTVTEAPGWTADWLNGWLAAIGVTMLAPRDEDSEGWLRVSWTDSPDPHALIHHPEGTSAPDLIASRLPTQAELDSLVVATEALKGGSSRKPQQTFTADQYRELASVERMRQDGYLAAYATDLDARKATPVKGALNPAAPGKTCAPFKGAFDCRFELDEAVAEESVADAVLASMKGLARRMVGNGLSFDVRRIPAGVGGGKKTVDPVVELLVFCAMPFFPVRSSGWCVRTRGWDEAPSKEGSLTWFTWGVPLDRWAIDALVDRQHRAARSERYTHLPDMSPVKYRLVPHRPIGDRDNTRGYGSAPR